MNITRSFLGACFGVSALVACALIWPAPTHAQSVVLVVNGEAITGLDIEQRIKLVLLTSRKTITRQQAIDELIDDKVKIREGKKYSIDLSPTDVDGAYANMSSRMRVTPDQLSKQLEGSGVRPEAFKNRMKAEMVWSSLVRGRFKDSLLVGEKDVQSIVEIKNEEKPPQDANASVDTGSYEYTMRPIVLVVPRGAAPGVIEMRKKEADALRNRISSCEEATGIFRNMRDAAIRDSLVKTSADLPANLREVLNKTPVGKLTAPEVTKQGVEMVALCARKTTTADTPQKREARDKLYAAKYEAKSKSYLQEVRKAAMIEYR